MKVSKLAERRQSAMAANAKHLSPAGLHAETLIVLHWLYMERRRHRYGRRRLGDSADLALDLYNELVEKPMNPLELLRRLKVLHARCCKPGEGGRLSGNWCGPFDLLIDLMQGLARSFEVWVRLEHASGRFGDSPEGDFLEDSDMLIRLGKWRQKPVHAWEDLHGFMLVDRRACSEAIEAAKAVWAAYKGETDANLLGKALR